jgi:hypothetical protein
MFVCPAHFTTIDCRGWSCDWSAPQPVCKEKDEGDYADNQTCVNMGNCKVQPSMKKCDFAKKQCVPCTQGEAGCNTDAFCQAIGCETKQFMKCNYVSKKCEPCTPTSINDKNCSQDENNCGKLCAENTLGICDELSGKCEACDPNAGSSTGCVMGCNDTCTPAPDPHHDNLFTCKWDTGHPVCSNLTMGKESKLDCDKNCVAPGYAKCNTQTGKCQECNQTTDPDCRYTKDYCDASCRPVSPSGLYRGVSIAKGFKQGEWDFDMTVAGAAKITIYPEGSGAMEAYEALPAFDGTSQSADGSPIAFTFTSVPSGGSMPFKTGDKLSGMYKKQPGQQGIFTLVTIGTGKANQAAPASFDDAMQDGYVWRLYACKQAGANGCNFDSTTGVTTTGTGLFEVAKPRPSGSITIN